jgi:large subunit ribosomal protein L13
MRTYVAKGTEAEALKVGANWFVVDATNQVLGRLATKVARLLIGKDKASFTPYLDSGDHVVVNKPDWMIREAVLGMLPKNKLRARRAKKLRIYRDAAGLARHAGQKPQSVAL